MDTTADSHSIALACPLLAHCLVSAGPGSGKTHFLVARTSRVYSEVPESFCYCVSFTNESSNEIRKRLSTQFPKHGLRIKCSTIHKFCLEGLNILSPNTTSLKIIRNDNILCEILSDLITPTDREHLYREISKLVFNQEADEEIVDIDCSTDEDTPSHSTPRDLFFMKHILRLSRMPLAPPGSLIPLLTAFRARLTEMHALDFQTIVRTFFLRLPSLASLPFPLTHLFVDEFQDLDAEQVSLLLLLVRQFGVTLTAVGDPNQSIYAWRKFSENIENFQTVKKNISVASFRLLENYRSDWKIVQASNSLIDDSLASIPTLRSSEARVAATAATSAKHELALIVNLIQEETKGTATVAVLFRYNMDKERVVKLLREKGISFSQSFKMKKIKRTKSFIQILWILRTLCFPSDRRARAQACLTGSGKALAESLKKTVFKDISFLGDDDPLLIQNESGEATAPVDRVPFQCQFALTSFDSKLKKIASECVLITDVVAHVIPVTKPADVAAFLVQFGDVPVANCWPVIAAKPCGLSNLFLGTIHSGKGREWDTVILPFVNEGVIPNDRATSLAEERRVMYVAMTRAKTTLLLTCTQGGGVHPSRFLFDSQIPLGRSCKRGNEKLSDS